MTKRNIALTAAKIAGYHGDTRTYTRLIIESRVARPYMEESYRNGQAAKIGGVKCECYECKGGN